ncbi:MAG: hypothetical protein IPL73_20305 [Candidatus Obscuribacter sp.]|nr:hypothetical protein [Candidatus Obscuribacter sp.]
MSTVPDKDNKAPDPKEVQAPKAGDSQVAKVEDKAHQAGLQEAQGADALKIIQKQAENTATAHVPGLTIVDNGKAVKPGEKSEGVKSYVNAALAISTEAVSAVINEAEKGIKALGKAVGIGGDAEGEGKKTDVAAAKSGDKSHAADKAPAANAGDKTQTAGTNKVITDGGSVAIGGPITGDGRVNRDSVIFRGPTTSQPGSGAERQVATGTDATKSNPIAPENGLIKASLVTPSEIAPDAKAKEVATPRPELDVTRAVPTRYSDAANGITRDQKDNIVRTEDGKGNGFEYFRDEKTGEILGANSLKDGKTNVALGGPSDKYAIDETTKLPIVIHPDKSTTSYDDSGKQITRNADGLTTSVKLADGTFTSYTYQNDTMKSSLTKYPGDAGTKEQLFTPSGTVTVTRDASGAASVMAEVPGANAIQVNPGDAIRTNASSQVVIASANGNERVVFGDGNSQLTEKSTGQTSGYTLKGEIVSVSGSPQRAAVAEAPKPPAAVEAPKPKTTDTPSPVVANLEATKLPQANPGDAPVVVPPAKQLEPAKDAPAVAKDGPAVAKDAPAAKPGEPEKEKSYLEQAKDLAGKVADGTVAAVSVAADAAISAAKAVKEFVVGPDDIKFGDEKYSKSGDKWKGADGKLYNDVAFDKDAKKLVLKGVDGSVEEHLQSGEKVITSKDANDRSNVVKLDASGKPTEVTTDGQKLQFDPSTKKWTDDTGRAVNDVTYNAANGDVSVNWNGTTIQTVSRSGESNVTDAQRGFSAKYDAKGNLTEVQDKFSLYKVTEDPAKPGQPVWKDSDGNTCRKSLFTLSLAKCRLSKTTRNQLESVLMA